MKSEDMPKGMYIPQPFASGDGTFTPEVEDILVERNLNEVNFVEGFPSVFSTPHSQGGRLVTRGIMNAIGLIATANSYARACGGITTFDPRLAVKIGGYPRGAVLEIIEDLDYHKVISLVDDNKVDFNGDELTEDQISAGITLGSIDGVNWAYCANGSIDTNVEVASLPNFSWLNGGERAVDMFPLATFVAKKNGILTFDGSYDMASSFSENIERTELKTTQSGSTVTSGEETGTQRYEGGHIIPNTFVSTGFMILCTEDIGHNPSQSVADVIYSRGNLGITMGGITYGFQDVKAKSVVKGTKYALYILNQNAVVTNSTMKIRIS